MNKTSGIAADLGRPALLGGAPSDANAADRIDVKALAAVLWRHKRGVIGATALLVAVAVAVVTAMPDKYAATAKVMLNTREIRIADAENVVSDLKVDSDAVESEIQVVLSSTIVGAVIDRLNLMADPEFNGRLKPPSALSSAIGGAYAALPDALRALLEGEPEPFDAEADRLAERLAVTEAVRESLAVSQIGRSVVLAVTAETEAPGKSAAIANAMVEIYLDDQVGSKRDATEKATAWLAERAVSQRDQLEAAETALKTHLAQANFVDEDILAEKNRQLKELRDQSASVESQSQSIMVELALARERLEAGDPVAAARALRDRPPALERALAQPDPDGRQMAALATAQIARLEDRLAADATRMAGLQQGVRRLEEEIARENGDLVTLRQLESEVEAARLVYEALLSRLNETQQQSGMLQADARLISAAQPPRNPASPNRKLIVALAGAVGLMIGAAIAFLRESLTVVMRSAAEVEETTGVSVLAHLPEVVKIGRRQELLEYLHRKPGSPLMEGGHALRTAIYLSNIDRPPQVVMVTSSVSGEGKSTTSLLLGQVSSAIGKSTVVVDCDLRRPTMRRSVNLWGPADLLAVIDGSTSLEDALVRNSDEGPYFLATSRPVVQAANLLASDRFAGLIEELRRRFEFIVLDAPPVLYVSDPCMLGRHADTSIYAIRWNATARGMVSVGLRKLREHGVDVSGTILTRVDFDRAVAFDQATYGTYGTANPYFSAS